MIEDWTQYYELFDMLSTAHETLRTASTQGAHYKLIAYLKQKFGISCSGREDAMRTANRLLQDFERTQTGESDEDAYYAMLADAA